jgi:hypothetical protein
VLVLAKAFHHLLGDQAALGSTDDERLHRAAKQFDEPPPQILGVLRASGDGIREPNQRQRRRIRAQLEQAAQHSELAALRAILFRRRSELRHELQV